jgi:pilus assembly protein CpaF
MLIGLGPLDALVRDDSVISVQVMGHDCVLAQRSGVWQREPSVAWDSPQDLRIFGEALAARAGQELSPERLVCQASFKNPAGRIQIDGTARTESRLTIHLRLGRQRAITLADMQASGCMSQAMFDLLIQIAKRRLGVLIVGLPGTGKTTLLEAWVEHWPLQPTIALDDRSEFHPRHPLIATYDVPAERLADACAFALRKNVDRMTIAEVRGDEAAEMLRYSGALTSWTTLHGNTHNAVSRLMALVQGAEGSPYVNISTDLLKEVIAHAFPLLVETEKMVIGGRAVFFVSHIDYLDDDAVPHPLFQANVEGGEVRFVETGDSEAFLERYPRRIYGGTDLPSLEMLASLVDESPPLALAALGEMLRVRPSDQDVIALIRRLIRGNRTIRAALRAGVKERARRVGAAVDSKDWVLAQQLVRQALSNPIVRTIGGEVDELQLTELPPDELGHRAKAATEAEEVLAVATGAQHLLSLLGLLESVKKHPERFDGTADALEKRLAGLTPKPGQGIHYHGLREASGESHQIE